MVNAKNAIKKFLKNAWKSIQPPRNAWNVNKIKKALSLLFLVILVDQFLKKLAIENLLPDWQFFVYICNPYLATGYKVTSSLFWSIYSLALIFIVLFTLKKGNLFLVLALAGTISNLIDRIFRSCVVDYILTSHSIVLNLADVSISLGFLLFVLFFKSRSLFKKEPFL